MNDMTKSIDTRIFNAAREMGLSVEEFSQLSDKEILRAPNIGGASLRRLRALHPVGEASPFGRVVMPAPVLSQPNGSLDIFVVDGDHFGPIKLRTRGASDAWVDLTLTQALNVARELIRLVEERIGDET